MFIRRRHLFQCGYSKVWRLLEGGALIWGATLIRGHTLLTLVSEAASRQFLNNCCFPDQWNVGHHTNKFIEKRLDLCIKYFKPFLFGFLLQWSHLLLIFNPTDTDVFKTSSGRLEKVTTSYDQTRRRHNVLQKTSDSRRLEDVRFTSRFTSCWRCPIYVVLKTSNVLRLEDVWLTTSWRRLIYEILKTSVKRRLCSSVIAASIQRRKKWFF